TTAGELPHRQQVGNVGLGIDSDDPRLRRGPCSGGGQAGGRQRVVAVPIDKADVERSENALGGGARKEWQRDDGVQRECLGSRWSGRCYEPRRKQTAEADGQFQVLRYRLHDTASPVVNRSTHGSIDEHLPGGYVSFKGRGRQQSLLHHAAARRMGFASLNPSYILTCCSLTCCSPSAPLQTHRTGGRRWRPPA